MADIFISYKSERRPAARHLKKVLDCYFQSGPEEVVWYDYGLIPGHTFESRLMAELRSAKVVLVLWCELAVKSEWVGKEALEAQQAGTYLPVWIETCKLPRSFAGADTINLIEWDGAPRSHQLDRLLEHIGRRVGRDPAMAFARIRELDEDWRMYGAPSLAKFALGKSLTPGPEVSGPHSAKLLLPEKPPPGISANLMRHWENARGGDARSLFNVAYHFEKGSSGLVKNEKEAARLYEISAESGETASQNNLGLMYANGRGVNKNDEEAVRLYRLSAEQGNAIGQRLLAFMLANGRGVQQNEEEALRLYRLAVDQGDAQAQNNLGAMYEHGTVVPKDAREAVNLYKLSADQSNPSGMASLAHMYERGAGGLPVDATEAVRLYVEAARAGNDRAQKRLTQLGKNWI